MAQGSSKVDVTGAAPTPDEIRSRLERTRAEMSETIDAEATMGRPKQFGDRTRESCAGVLGRVRENPLPAVLVATAAAAVFVYALQNAKGRRRQLKRRLVRLTAHEPDPAIIDAW